MKISSYSFDKAESYFGCSLSELLRVNFITEGVAREFWTVEGERIPEIDLCELAGIRFRFRNNAIDLPKIENSLLIGAVYHAKGDFLSPGFYGTLPQSIRFSDDRTSLLKKVDLPIVSEGYLPQGGESLGFTGDCGFLEWQDKGFRLHVLYLVKGQRTIRVTSMLDEPQQIPVASIA